jgi:putative ABC transport system permease protein
MLFNYIKVAFRNLSRNSVYSFINIVGLAVGLASSILIALWVIDELSYDRLHKNADALAQVWINATYDGKVNTYQSLPLPTYSELKTRLLETGEVKVYWPLARKGSAKIVST